MLGEAQYAAGMRLPILILLGCWTLGSAHADTACMAYMPQTVTLAGTVTKAQAYGAPGYGVHPATDSVDRWETISLDQPICVSQSADGFLRAQSSVTQVQLYLPKQPSGSGFAGRHVKVTGALFPSHSGRHHTNVLVAVEQIEP